MAAALLELGYRTCHCCFDDSQFQVADAFFDTPVYADYAKLDREYPGSKFIHTERDPESWFRSVETALPTYLENLSRGRLTPKRQINRRCWGAVFGTFILERTSYIECYERHGRLVREYFAGRRNQLLVMNLEADLNPWRAVCKFLDRLEPVIPFPIRNCGTTTDWERIDHPLKISSTST